MQSNGQFLSSGRFTLGKDLRYPLDKEMGCSVSWTGHGVEMKKFYVGFKRCGGPFSTMKWNF
jgi:hypothetical protein